MSRFGTKGRDEGKAGFFKNLDYPTVCLYLLLVAFGWITIYAASYDVGLEGQFSLEGRISSQMMWMIVSGVAAIAALTIDASFYKTITPSFYVGMILLLLVTIFIAPDIKGSHSWLVITDSIRLQPAEFGKLATALMLSLWLDRYTFDMKKASDLAVAFLIFLLPMVIIVLQNETGSALVFVTFVLVLYREGLTGAVPLAGLYVAALFVLTLSFSGRVWGITHAEHLILPLYIITGILLFSALHYRVRYLGLFALGAVALSFLVAGIVSFFIPVDFAIPSYVALALVLGYLVFRFFIGRNRTESLLLSALGGLSLLLQSGVIFFFQNILQPHQQNRILVSLGLKSDPSGAGYNVQQSLIAIGSGGFFGKGFLKGTQTKLSFVPEQDTDFIFCTVGEEQGFVGSVLLLGLYLVLLLRLIKLAERQTTRFSRVYGYCVAAILFFHLTINIGMVIGFVPVIGIPLPYFSYGGSSLLSFTLLLFIFLRLDAARRPEN